MSRWSEALLCSALLGISLSVSAAEDFSAIGRAATPAEIKAWDIDVRPDFLGLPAGSSTVTQGKQVFIATQSPYMVDCFELSNIIVADNHGGETTLRNLPADAYQQWLDDDYLLSDIWLKSPAGSL